MTPLEVKTICEAAKESDWVGIAQALGAVASPLIAFWLLYKQRKFDLDSADRKVKDDFELCLKAGIWHGNQLLLLIEEIQEKIKGESLRPFTTYQSLKIKVDIVMNELLIIPNWQTKEIKAFARITDLRSVARLTLEMLNQLIAKPIDEISLFQSDSDVAALAQNAPSISRKDVLLLQIDSLYGTCKEAVQQLLDEAKAD